MPSKQLHFFATYDDIAEVLEQFELEQPVTYVLTGLFDHDNLNSFETFRAINSLAISADGDSNHMPGYLINNRSKRIAVRRVPQKTGGQKFAIDQCLNQDALYFQSSGIFGKEIIVPGRVGIVSETSDSKKLYGAMSRLIMRSFRKVASYRVGPGAVRLMETGTRLGLSLNASRDLDLKHGS